MFYLTRKRKGNKKFLGVIINQKHFNSFSKHKVAERKGLYNVGVCSTENSTLFLKANIN